MSDISKYANLNKGQFPSTTINLSRSFKSTFINPARLFAQAVNVNSTEIETTAPVSSTSITENNKQTLDILAQLSLPKELQTILATFSKLI
ncbi:hypothetical protein CDAR_201941 [Caerostris darwini]|uniref:Uncharacterized protein n=1 Tax=Caerostris darwini TaxID=1538125 RepID=A0AAV4UW53_9ARAC|nr:hypothetical protein CDAR_201941 [Caerostris darwini]